MKDPFRDLLLDVYDTVAHPQGWSEILDQITRDLNAHGCIVFEWQTENDERKLTTPYYSGRFEEDALALYLDKCFTFEAADQDQFEAHSLADDAIDLIDDTVLAPDLAALKQLPNVEILQKFGILHRAAGLLDKDNTHRARFSVQLGVERGRLTPAEHDYLQRLLPHVAKALDLGRPARLLRQQHRSILNAMDHLTIGIAILDPKSRVIIDNGEFRRQQDSFQVFKRAANGVLSMSSAEDQTRFDALKSDVARHGRFGARARKEAVSSGQDTFLCIEVAPLHRAEEMGSTPLDGCILYSIDTSLPIRCHALPIQQAFGLTNTEADLLQEIAKGLTNIQIAERRGRAAATVNNQVKAILSKTQCTTRTQLVRLMSKFGTDFLAQPSGNATA